MAAQPRWSFYLVDASGSLVADLSLLDDVVLTYQLKGPSTLTGTLPLTSSAAALVSSGGLYVKAYRVPANSTTRTLRFYGPLEVDEVQGGGSGNGVDKLAITAFDPSIILSMRYTSGSFSSTDRGAIIKSMIDTTNTADETGIRTSTSNIETSSTTSVDYPSSQPLIRTVIDNFADALDGCDCEFRPIELASSKICDLYVWRQRGSSNTGTVFGYGATTVANCSAMRRVRNRSVIANYTTAFYGGTSTTYTDATSVASYRRRDSQLNLTAETSATEATQTVNGYTLDRVDATAVAEYSLTTTSRAPRLWDDYEIGDTVTLDFDMGVSFTVVQRVKLAALSVDAQGVETTSQLVLGKV